MANEFLRPDLYSTYADEDNKEAIPNRPYIIQNRRPVALKEGSEFTPVDYKEPLNYGAGQSADFDAPPEGALTPADVYGKAKFTQETLYGNAAKEYAMQQKERLEQIGKAPVTDYSKYAPDGVIPFSEPPPIGQDTKTTFKIDSRKQTLMYELYDSFRKQGFDHSASAALTANVGRENGYNPDIMFGSHIDSNRANYGFFSYNQGRGKEFLQEAVKAGVWDDRAKKVIQNKQGIDFMASFAVQEMQRKPEYKKAFAALKDPNLPADRKADIFAQNYLRPNAAAYNAHRPKQLQYLKFADTAFKNAYDQQQAMQVNRRVAASDPSSVVAPTDLNSLIRTSGV